MAKKKQTAEEIAAAVELQLSERRFILEAMNASATVLQVPIVTAFVWYYLSRTNAALGALNKAILAAELAPIVGDIKFPEGVLLGAAMESSEDVLKILEGYGLGTVAGWKAQASEQVEDTGDLLANLILEYTPSATCEELTIQASINRDHARGLKPGTNEPHGSWVGARLGMIGYALSLKELKKHKCDRPHFVAEGTWLDA